jgi:hypothetical protein
VSGFFCVDDDFRENSNFGSFTQKEYYYDGVVLCVRILENPLIICSCTIWLL